MGHRDPKSAPGTGCAVLRGAPWRPVWVSLCPYHPSCVSLGHLVSLLSCLGVPVSPSSQLAVP